VIGDKDIEAQKVTLESRDKGNLGQLAISEVIKKLKEEMAVVIDNFRTTAGKI
jgi:threonyl-tRNA synthetase